MHTTIYCVNNGENPWRIGQDVKAQINDARNNGENVGLAYHDYVSGMNDLHSGNQQPQWRVFVRLKTL